MMKHQYDIFEKFPDGSTLWRAFVSGRFEAWRRVQELEERSENDFVILDIQSEQFLPAGARTQKRPAARAASAG
jgi:hypothetical protein